MWRSFSFSSLRSNHRSITNQQLCHNELYATYNENDAQTANEMCRTEYSMQISQLNASAITIVITAKRRNKNLITLVQLSNIATARSRARHERICPRKVSVTFEATTVSSPHTFKWLNALIFGGIPRDHSQTITMAGQTTRPIKKIGAERNRHKYTGKRNLRREKNVVISLVLICCWFFLFFYDGHWLRGRIFCPHSARSKCVRCVAMSVATSSAGKTLSVCFFVACVFFLLL